MRVDQSPFHDVRVRQAMRLKAAGQQDLTVTLTTSQIATGAVTMATVRRAPAEGAQALQVSEIEQQVVRADLDRGPLPP
jgi:hypothetical protein